MTTTRAARSAEVILYAGDDYPKLAEARNRLDAAEARQASKDTPARGGGDDVLDELVEARQAWEAAVDVAAERATGVKLTALGRKRWRSLLNDHKPRQGDKEDADVGYNRDTFPDAVVPVCLLEPVYDVPADRDEWLDCLSEGEYEQLFLVALSLNVGAPVDPKDLARRAPSSAATGR